MDTQFYTPISLNINSEWFSSFSDILFLELLERDTNIAVVVIITIMKIGIFVCYTLLFVHLVSPFRFVVQYWIFRMFKIRITRQDFALFRLSRSKMGVLFEKNQIDFQKTLEFKVKLISKVTTKLALKVA